MDPRKVRLVAALTAALLLAGALIYTSFNTSTQARMPSELTRSEDGRTYQLTGKVVADSIKRDHDQLIFRVADRQGPTSVPVHYSGTVPDPFRAGREVIVNVHKQGNVYIGERDSLVTKCPSKFSGER
jgi:cytochrome c-type biogenesis protein CcmE